MLTVNKERSSERKSSKQSLVLFQLNTFLTLEESKLKIMKLVMTLTKRKLLRHQSHNVIILYFYL